MAGNEVEIRVRGTNADAKQTLREVEDAEKKVGEQAKRTGRDFVEQAVAARILGRQIDDLEGEMRDLARQIVRTGDEAQKLKLQEKFDVDRNQLAQLKKLAAAFGEAGGEGGKQFNKSFGEMLGALPGQLKGGAIVAGVALGAALSPLILSAVAAAVLGSVGGGGIAGGIALASRDSRVKDAATGLTDSLAESFEPIGAKFVEPVVRALHSFEGAGARLATNVAPGMEKLARLVDPLADDLGRAADNLGVGFNNSVDGALPVVRAMGDELVEITEAVGDFLETISEDSDGAVLALETISEFLQDQFKLWGYVISGAEQAYEWMVRNGNVAMHVASALGGWIPVIGDIIGRQTQMSDELLMDLGKAKDASDDFKGSLDSQIESLEREQEVVDALTQEFNRLFGIQMGIDEATIRYEKSIDELTESIKENGKTLDVNKEKGRDNREAVLNQIDAIADLRQANIDNGMSIAEADRKYQQQLNSLEKNLLQMGLNRAEVKKIIDAYRGIPSEVSTSVTAPGLAGVLARMRELDRLYYSSPAFVEYRAGERNPSGHAYGGAVSSAATGGNRGGLVQINEQGAEVARLPDGSIVIPHGQSTQMMQNLAGSGGGGVSRLEIVAVRTSGNALMDAIIEGLRFKIDSEGQGDVQQYLGSPA